MELLGIAFAVGALLSWGFGDFSIQRCVRAIGDLKTFFVIDLSAVLILFPFVWRELPEVFTTSPQLMLLVGTGFVIFVAGMLDFEALRRGKIAIIEPALSFELPIAIFLASVL